MYKLWCVLGLLAVVQISMAQDVTSFSTEDIDTQLINIEKQRTGNVKDFVALLDEVNQHKLMFNDYQRCLYNYLELYNKALVSGFGQSLPGFRQLYQSCEDQRIRIRVKNMEANILSFTKQYRPSIEALDYSLNAIAEVDDKHLLTMVYSTAFIVYGYIEQYPLSLQFSELLMDESDSLSDQCKGKSNRLKIYLKQEEVKVTWQEIEQVFDYCISLKEPIYAYMLKMDWYRYLLEVSEADTDWGLVYSQIVDDEPVVNGLGYPYLSRYVLLLKFHLLFKQGDETAVQSSVEALLSQGDQFESSESKIAFLKLMVAHFKKTNEPEKALDYMEQMQDEMDEFYQDKQNKQVAFQVVKHESMAGQLQNELLTKQNKILQIEQDLAKKNMLNQRLITAVISLLGLLLIFWGVRLLRKHSVMKEAASRDYLTGCYNRQTFEAQVKSLLNRLEVKDLILHLSIMDLDHFKTVNDRFGHLKGDVVLKKVIAYCETQLTERMLLGRLGGEEFGIFIIETNSREMMDKLNKIREGVQALDFSEIDDSLDMTASFGVASSLTSGYQWQTLISHADEALYKAKAQGRNRVYRFDLAHTE